MGGLFSRARWFGAPVLSFAPSSPELLHPQKLTDASPDRLIAELRALLDSMETEDDARAFLTKAEIEVLQTLASKEVASRPKRLRMYVSVLETYLHEREASDISLKSAARTTGN